MNVPDAWDDEWSTAADGQESAQPETSESKKPNKKQTKAQKRAAQAEFNRQLWAEAEGPRETNYFLESRNVVPHRQEFKTAPVLLSRKGPIVQKSRPTTIETGVDGLKIREREESSEDEDDQVSQQKALDDAKVQAAKDREEKQRKYEERRLELFGPSAAENRPNSRSGGSSPANLTPPGSRSSTPSRGGKRGRGRGNQSGQPRVQPQQYQPYQQQQLREVYDQNYSAKPNSTFLLRREQGQDHPNKEIQPIREPKAPDGSGRDGAGFVSRRTTLIEETRPTAQGYQI